jgi:hypothetical protein
MTASVPQWLISLQSSLPIMSGKSIKLSIFLTYLVLQTFNVMLLIELGNSWEQCYAPLMNITL